MIYIDKEKKLKYNTYKMEKVADEIRISKGKGKLYVSKKRNWLFVENYYGEDRNARPVSEEEALDLIAKYAPCEYEKYFGELEEA